MKLFNPVALSVPICLGMGVLAAAPQGKPDYRPAIHFTPERNWMNDPNGMVYFEGEWHLFYQYNPEGDTWGHMSWGHAVSRDLLHWNHLPLAIPEANGVMIFSGSAVVDWNNSSGLGKEGKAPLIAIYTGHQAGRQDQRIAYSNDKGRTWTNYAGNPVLDLRMADFRDPKVHWNEKVQAWVMVVALPNERKVHFYQSKDLKQWNYSGEFGPAGSTVGIWECPDLFPLKTERGGLKWVLIVNVGSGAPAGGSGTQYFVGEFDGKSFKQDAPSASKAEFVPKGNVLADFESGYAGWTPTGEAFGQEPANGTLPNQQPVSGFRGKGFVNSYLKGDGSQGALTSPVFRVSKPYISFLIGGGPHPQTRLELLIDGKQVRIASGSEMERLSWKSWDVREFIGREAQLRIVDEHSGGWGHVNVDHILEADQPARPASEAGNWTDFGPDFYAGVSWSDVPQPDGRRIFLGWMSNWEYAGQTPTSPWRSAMSLPRELALRQSPDGWKLLQRPVRELARLRKPEPAREAGKWKLPRVCDFELTIEGISDKNQPSIRLDFGNGEGAELSILPAQGKIRFDRTTAGNTAFHPRFARVHEAPLRLIDGKLTLRMIVDVCSIEVFAQDGETVLTELIFPTGSDRSLEVFPGGAKVRKAALWEIR